MAVGAGFCDGLDMGDNTKAAVIRLGLMEMIKFAEQFYPSITFLQLISKIFFFQNETYFRLNKNNTTPRHFFKAVVLLI